MLEPTHDETGLLDYWQMFVRRRWLLVLSTTSALLVSVVASFLAVPQYRATATVQIERRSPDILTFRDLSQLDYSWTAYSDFYQTQYKILASEPVARRAATDLSLDTHPAVVGSPGRGPGLLARLRSLLPSRSSPSERTPLDRATDVVLGRLEIGPVRNSQLVRISWSSPDPHLAARVANGVAEAYVALNLESQFSTSDQAEEFLGNQIGELKREVADLEGRLQEYGAARRIVSIDDRSNVTLQALQAVGEQRTAAQMRLAAAEAAWRTALGSPDDSLPEVIQSPLIAELRQQHAELEAELGEKARKFGADWPGVQTLSAKMQQARTVLDDQIGRIARQVRSAAESDYQRARAELGNLDHLLDNQEGAAQQLKRESVEYANLQSEVDKKRETLSALITRQNEMALATRLADLEATSSNIRLLSRAEPPVHPFKPAVRFNLLLGLLIGVGAGVALVILLERLDNTVSSIEDLRRAAGWPLLAVIPHHERAPGGAVAPLLRLGRRGRETPGETVDLVTQHAGQGASAEGYRDLRTAILLSSPGHPPRTLMITSALPEEGKSATAINLAVVLAHTEARVLLIDTDLRRPRLHRAFGTTNARGVTSCLSGMERDVRALVQPTGVEGLDLLASGPVPPNPSELLNSPQFRELASRLLESGYQHLVFDSPPVLSVSDPVIAATSMECCILVVRADRTPRPSVRLAVDKLAAAVGGTAGIVLNDLDPSRWGRAYYGGTYYGGRYRADDAERSDAAPPVEPARARSRRRGA